MASDGGSILETLCHSASRDLIHRASLALVRQMWYINASSEHSLTPSSMELNSDLCVLQTSDHFGHPLEKPLTFVAIVTFRPPAVVTVQGHCRNAGSFLQPGVVNAPQFIDLPWRLFGEPNALQRLRCIGVELLRVATPDSNRSMRGSSRSEGVDMYATKAINGVPAIQRDGQSVLSVCGQDGNLQTGYARYSTNSATSAN